MRADGGTIRLRRGPVGLGTRGALTRYRRRNERWGSRIRGDMRGWMAQ